MGRASTAAAIGAWAATTATTIGADQRSGSATRADAASACHDSSHAELMKGVAPTMSTAIAPTVHGAWRGRVRRRAWDRCHRCSGR